MKIKSRTMFYIYLTMGVMMGIAIEATNYALGTPIGLGLIAYLLNMILFFTLYSWRGERE